MDIDKGVGCLIVILLACLVVVCGHADGWFDYSDEEVEGTVIECYCTKYYAPEYVGNGLAGFHWEDCYQGTYQTIKVAISYGYYINDEYRLPRAIKGYNIAPGTKVRINRMKRPLNRYIHYYKVELL